MFRLSLFGGPRDGFEAEAMTLEPVLVVPIIDPATRSTAGGKPLGGRGEQTRYQLRRVVKGRAIYCWEGLLPRAELPLPW